MAAMHINHEQFHQLMKGDKPVLVDFWAPWCVYCRKISDAYDRIAEQYGDKIEVVKVNIDDNEALAQEQEIEIIPTLVLYQGGKAWAAMQGRAFVIPEDIQTIFIPVMNHRITLTSEARLKKQTADSVLIAILEGTAVPPTQKELFGRHA